jgi:alkylhydroperoxidase family enzyme
VSDRDGPRVRPLPPGGITEEVRAALKGWMRPDATELSPPLDTLARHPELARAYLAFSRHLLYTSTLSPRARELVILRTAAITGSAFERAQHEVIARREGIDDADIDRVADGADAPGWSPADAALLRATDELLSTWTVRDATWDQLAPDLDEHQLMDLVFTVGNYALLAMALNAFGVRPDLSAPRPAEQWGRGEGPPG